MTGSAVAADWPLHQTERVMATALQTTVGAAERIIAATDFDPHPARDLRRVLDRRRQLWE